MAEGQIPSTYFFFAPPLLLFASYLFLQVGFFSSLELFTTPVPLILFLPHVVEFSHQHERDSDPFDPLEFVQLLKPLMLSSTALLINISSSAPLRLLLT